MKKLTVSDLEQGKTYKWVYINTKDKDGTQHKLISVSCGTYRGSMSATYTVYGEDDIVFKVLNFETGFQPDVIVQIISGQDVMLQGYKRHLKSIEKEYPAMELHKQPGFLADTEGRLIGSISLKCRNKFYLVS